MSDAGAAILNAAAALATTGAEILSAKLRDDERRARELDALLRANRVISDAIAAHELGDDEPPTKNEPKGTVK